MAWIMPGRTIIEASIRYTLNAQTLLSIFHYRLVTNTNQADGEAVLNAFNSAFNDVAGVVDKIAGVTSQDLIIDQVVLQAIYPTRFRRYVYEPVQTAGQIAEDSLPQNVSVAITKRADEASRHGIGTLHMPAVPPSYVEGGYLTALAVNEYTTVADEMLVEYGTPEFEPVLFNRANPAASLRITAADVRNTSRVQRRRTVGLGI